MNIIKNISEDITNFLNFFNSLSSMIKCNNDVIPNDMLLTLKIICIFYINENYDNYSDYFERKKFSRSFKMLPLIQRIDGIDIPFSNDDLDLLKMFQLYIKAALDQNFTETLKLALELKNSFFQSKNPHIIMMEAIDYKNRNMSNNNNDNNKKLKEYLLKITETPENMLEQLNYLNYLKSKYKEHRGIPNILKKIWAKKLGNMDIELLEKYKKIIPKLAKISHPINNPFLFQIMHYGSIKTRITCEKMRSQGKKWIEILDKLEWNISHDDALANLLSFAREMKKDGNNGEYLRKYQKMVLNSAYVDNIVPTKYLEIYQKYKKYLRNGKLSENRIIIEILESCLEKYNEEFESIESSICFIDNNRLPASIKYDKFFRYKNLNISDIIRFAALFTAYKSRRGIVAIPAKYCYNSGYRILTYKVNKNKSIFEQFDKICENCDNCYINDRNIIFIFFKNILDDIYSMYSFMGLPSFGRIYIYSDIYYPWDMSGEDYDGINYSKLKKYGDYHDCIDKLRRIYNKDIQIYMFRVSNEKSQILPANNHHSRDYLGEYTGREIPLTNRIKSFQG